MSSEGEKGPGGSSREEKGKGKEKNTDKDEVLAKNRTLISSLSLASKLAVITLAENYVDLDSAQLTATLRSMVNETVRKDEVVQFEADSTHIETILGKEGDEGFYAYIQNKLKSMPSVLEKPLEFTRSFHLDQAPGLALSIMDAVVQLVMYKAAVFVDFRAPAISPDPLRLFIARIKPALEKGAEIIMGTCVTESLEYSAAYQGCVDAVLNDKVKGSFGIYLYKQHEGFASPHAKGIVALYECGELIAGSTDANWTKCGTGASVHLAPSTSAAGAAAISSENLDLTLYDLRHPGREGLRRLETFHVSNLAIRGRKNFVWLTKGLVRENLSKKKVERPDKSKVEKKKDYKDRYKSEIKDTLDKPIHSDADVGLAVSQRSFVSATSSDGGVDLSKKAPFVNPKPLVPLATDEQREKIQSTVNKAFSLQPRLEKGKKPEMVSAAEKRKLRAEAEQELDLTPEQLEHLERAKRAKPLAAPTGSDPSYAIRPKLVQSLAKKSTVPREVEMAELASENEHKAKHAGQGLDVIMEGEEEEEEREAPVAQCEPEVGHDVHTPNSSASREPEAEKMDRAIEHDGDGDAKMRDGERAAQEAGDGGEEMQGDQQTPGAQSMTSKGEVKEARRAGAEVHASQTPSLDPTRQPEHPARKPGERTGYTREASEESLPAEGESVLGTGVRLVSAGSGGATPRARTGRDEGEDGAAADVRVPSELARGNESQAGESDMLVETDERVLGVDEVPGGEKLDLVDGGKRGSQSSSKPDALADAEMQEHEGGDTSMEGMQHTYDDGLDWDEGGEDEMLIDGAGANKIKLNEATLAQPDPMAEAPSEEINQLTPLKSEDDRALLALSTSKALTPGGGSSPGGASARRNEDVEGAMQEGQGWMSSDGDATSGAGTAAIEKGKEVGRHELELDGGVQSEKDTGESSDADDERVSEPSPSDSLALPTRKRTSRPCPADRPADEDSETELEPRTPEAQDPEPGPSSSSVAAAKSSPSDSVLDAVSPVDDDAGDSSLTELSSSGEESAEETEEEENGGSRSSTKRKTPAKAKKAASATSRRKGSKPTSSRKTSKASSKKGSTSPPKRKGAANPAKYLSAATLKHLAPFRDESFYSALCELHRPGQGKKPTLRPILSTQTLKSGFEGSVSVGTGTAMPLIVAHGEGVARATIKGLPRDAVAGNVELSWKEQDEVVEVRQAGVLLDRGGTRGGPRRSARYTSSEFKPKILASFTGNPADDRLVERLTANIFADL
ncbi:hypothetical protein JCM10207_005462 [Rhodosporidiobolus poonsookiae]